jgi:endopolyphosphatase
MYLNFLLLLALTSITLAFNFLPDWRSDPNNDLPQQPLDLPISLSSDKLTPPAKISKYRELKGRFLHISDIHPDPFYKENTDPDTACHRGKDEEGNTGKYGHPISRCDSPMTLVNATFDWIAKNLKNEIDFIVWTGDNVRHDRDNKHPRTESHIFDMNNLMVSKFLDFLKCDDPIHIYEVPVVPSIGNNDVYPHNLFAEGPTLQTQEFYRIWKDLIPEDQMHTFYRGASFMTEVIPGKLVVIAINTLYWFQSNPIVDGCDRRKDPGHKQFRFLSIILQEFRERGMKVWLSGHVPPNASNFEPSCLDRYSAWMHEYRDVVVGGLFGHMNVDHFLFLDSKAKTPELSVAEKNSMKFTCDIEDDDNIISTLGKVEYLDNLRESYAELEDDESGLNTRYSMSYVSSSIIPTYFPGLRVWEYNITGVEEAQTSVYSNGQPFRPWSEVFNEIEQELARLDEEDEYQPLGEEELAMSSTDFQKKKKKKADPTWPPNFGKDVNPGPAYLPQTFTPTRYVQYFANLTAANFGHKEFTFEKEYSTDQLPYNMTNLVVSSWVEFARKLASELITNNEELDISASKKKKNKKDKKGKKKKNKDEKKKTKKEVQESHKAWKTYLKHAFISSGFEIFDD